MAVTQTPRLKQTTWSQGIDTVSREQFNSDAAALDAVVALFGQGTANDRPAAGVKGRFYTVVGDSDADQNGRMFYDTGTAWVTANRYMERAIVSAAVATDAALTIRGVANQTGLLQRWQNSNSTTVASVTADGVGSFKENVLGGAGSALSVSTQSDKAAASFTSTNGDLARWSNATGQVAKIDNTGAATFRSVEANSLTGTSINYGDITSTSSSKLKNVLVEPLAGTDIPLTVSVTDTQTAGILTARKGTATVSRLTSTGRFIASSIVANYNVESGSADMNAAIGAIASSATSSALLGRATAAQSAPVIAGQDVNGNNVFTVGSSGEVFAGNGTFAGLYTTAPSAIAGVTPKFEVATGTSTETYRDTAVLRHQSTSTNAVSREILMAMKMSTEANDSESAKFAGVSAFTSAANSATPSLGLYAGGARMASLTSAGLLSATSLAYTGTLATSGNKQSILLQTGSDNSIAGMGVENGNMYVRSLTNSGINLYAGGVHTPDAGDPGTGGRLLAAFNGDPNDNRMTIGRVTLNSVTPYNSATPVLSIGTPAVAGNNMQFSTNSINVFTDADRQVLGNMYLNTSSGGAGRVDISNSAGATRIFGTLSMENTGTIKMGGRNFTVAYSAPSNPVEGDVWINI